jgi:hypothetical protein
LAGRVLAFAKRGQLAASDAAKTAAAQHAIAVAAPRLSDEIERLEGAARAADEAVGVAERVVANQEKWLVGVAKAAEEIEKEATDIWERAKAAKAAWQKERGG